jgi:hypothetical protein
MASPALVQPNHFQLSGSYHHGSHLNVSYTTHSGPSTPQFPQGPPRFTYQDASQSLSFSGKDVEVVETQLGQVVTVRIHLTVDQGSTTFSVLIPRVNLVPGQPTPIHTEGITTIHRLSLAPGLDRGQLDHYSVTPLHGSASDIIVPL